MSVWQWIVAGLVSALILYLLAAFRTVGRASNRVSNFAMLLLLDEFAYRRYRDEFIKLIETTKQDDPGILYATTMLEMEYATKALAPRAAALSRRMAAINRAARDGRSMFQPADSGDAAQPATSTPATLGDIVGRPSEVKSHAQIEQDARESSAAMVAGAVRFGRALTRLKQRLVRLLGGS